MEALDDANPHSLLMSAHVHGGIVRWTGDEDLMGENEHGASIPMHTSDTPNPVQLVLLAHGGCTLLDVITGLKHRMENVRDMWIELDAIVEKNHPGCSLQFE